MPTTLPTTTEGESVTLSLQWKKKTGAVTQLKKVTMTPRKLDDPFKRSDFVQVDENRNALLACVENEIVTFCSSETS